MLSVILVNKMIKKGVIRNEDKELYMFGIDQLITIIINISITLGISILFDNLLPTLIFLISYIPLRSFAGGYHAKTERRCFIYSIILIIFLQFYYDYFFFNRKYFNFAIMIVFALFIHAYAPIQSRYNLLSGNEKKYCKRVTDQILLLGILCFCMGKVFNCQFVVMGITSTFYAEVFLLLLGKISLK